jgi:hypothetical protein
MNESKRIDIKRENNKESARKQEGEETRKVLKKIKDI